MSENDNKANSPPKIQFHFYKSNNFRVARVDGGLGWVSPKGDIHFILYSERPAIPDMIEHELSEEGNLGKGRAFGKQGIAREVEIDLSVDADVARELGELFFRKADEAEALYQRALASEQASNQE